MDFKKDMVRPLASHRALLLCWAFVLAGSMGCTPATSSHPPTAEALQTTSDIEEPAQYPRTIPNDLLPNAIQVHEKVFSGGQPAGTAAFQELADLGIKTIICVDGARPDLESARQFGFKYVHLPHGYDGIPAKRIEELAKVVRDADGPIYIHCHHGKHRSPAAASVACVSAGLMPRELALQVLTLAGTSPSYRGLFQAAERALPIAPTVLDALPSEFPEAVAIPPMADAMIEIDHLYEQLHAVAAAHWSSPSDHPDLEPAHVALMLREQFTELLRTEETQTQPESFQTMLRESETATLELEELLREGAVAKPSPDLLQALQSKTEAIGRNCKACHEAFRDIPLSEK
ncbi:protein-tyrosine phosphatase family protein [Aureliella helgolandensis]|uniref:Cytochrome C n=1 Tax=Aureliella helgolandensis TaxID=2527968 RepID=A0A518GAI1_9BACT|nr:cytochrome c [Aureliella helgolandensis]QDV25590.1 hypothetical protein Q31a_39160 [Aureliella helgolandensis]